MQKREITAEVSPGLTCIGDLARTLSNGNAGGIAVDGSSTTITGTEGTTFSGASAAVVGAGTKISSRAGGAVITKAPVLVAGAATAFAYGAM